jgi:hypothetical protein
MSEEIDYSIRFIDISESDGELLSSKLKHSVTSFRARKKDQKLVFTADITTQNVNSICNLVPQIKAFKKDVFISLLPDSDSDIYDVPDYVVKVISLGEIALTVSFTYIEDE